MFKFARRASGVVVLTILSFRAVGSFLSWVDRQEDGPQSVWTDEDEFEDA
jgi:hypothetical protein